MLIEKARQRLYNSLEADLGPRAEIRQVQERIRDVVSKFLFAETRRRPMILPVVTEV